MAQLEQLTPGARVRGILVNDVAVVVSSRWFGSGAIEVTYKDSHGVAHSNIFYRDQEHTLDVVDGGRAWSFDGDGQALRLAYEAYRIRLAHLFDPMLAVHTSLVRPLPHQITAVYSDMLTRQPLRFLLADDPGAGKTIMAGLLIKELMARGDLKRCMIVSPGVLVEQWQDELAEKFKLDFRILTNEDVYASRTGNPFEDNHLLIVRLDKLSRNEELQDKLVGTDWDLIVVDEAHKLSASYFGGEVKKTLRYKLGEKLSAVARQFLLLTATPHNGKEADFQLFLGLLDGDRFEGKFREGVHVTNTQDLMRRMVKEELVTFEGTPLFPERRAYPLTYTLSDDEDTLYKRVTAYVREEFNRADNLDGQRKGTVGFALTSLQRRLASSPEAIYQSLRRRRERLVRRLNEEVLNPARFEHADTKVLAPDDLDDYDEATETEQEEVEATILDEATARETAEELRAEIQTLTELEVMADKVRRGNLDAKWRELSSLLQGQAEMFDAHGHRRKLVIFSEHRDTQRYLAEKIRGLLGRPEQVVTIDGSMAREERKLSQERFTQDKDVLVLIATDAAGEGINLQRAHLMVNYDLPWNPNRLEQRFGRIHRIGQTEVCHLWNLIAKNTREGEVFEKLFTKLEEQRKALGGKVFDVLGKLSFEDRPLKDVLIEAIRYGDKPEVKARLQQVVDHALDVGHLQDLLEERVLAHDSMDAEKVRRIRDDMERAQAKRLQPHHIASFFLEAFRHLGGTAFERESKRFELTFVPAILRQRDRQIGTGAAVLPRYERITFDKDLVNVPGKAQAAFICPGHPLLDSVLDLVLEQYRELLKQGAIWVDSNDEGTEPRVLLFMESSIQDGFSAVGGQRRVINRQACFLEITRSGVCRRSGIAPHLDLKPLAAGFLPIVKPFLEESWLRGDLENRGMDFAIQHMLPEQLGEVRNLRIERAGRTEIAVKERLTKEINYWDHRAEELKALEQAGRQPKMNAQYARRRADELQARMRRRLEELQLERQIIPSAPRILGGALIIPNGILPKLGDDQAPGLLSLDPAVRARIEKAAMLAVMAAERALGFEPVDVSAERCGYDIESREPNSGHLRFIEVKGRAKGADTVTVTRNEIITALHVPDHFILAVVIVEGEIAAEPRYIRRPFTKEPDFGEISSNYDLVSLLSQSTLPS
jgi:superfamily II DNA or RNA helicase